MESTQSEKHRLFTNGLWAHVCKIKLHLGFPLPVLILKNAFLGISAGDLARGRCLGICACNDLLIRENSRAGFISNLDADAFRQEFFAGIRF